MATYALVVHTDPGAIAPDGSPVEVYRRLPPGDEAEMIHGAIGGGSDILELGCGSGRITHRLVALGHVVTAVDQSAEMLAHVKGAETVLGDIEASTWVGRSQLWCSGTTSSTRRTRRGGTRSCARARGKSKQMGPRSSSLTTRRSTGEAE